MKVFKKIKEKSAILLLQFCESYLDANGFYTIPKYHGKHPKEFRLEHITKNNYSILLDVGANTGQFGCEVRYHGYKGKIISFEPITTPYEKLCEVSSSDSLWTAYNLALGNFKQSTKINISQNSYSSSILKIHDKHVCAERDSRVIDSQTVNVELLDNLFPDLCTNKDKVFLKIDTQGYELAVLQGGLRALEFIAAIQVEMSFSLLYSNQALFYDIYNFLNENKFILVSLEPSFIDSRNNELLQVDGLFIKQGYS